MYGNDNNPRPKSGGAKTYSPPPPSNINYTTGDESQSIVNDISNLGATTITGVTPVTEGMSVSGPDVKWHSQEMAQGTDDFLGGLGGAQIGAVYPGGVETLRIEESTQTAQRGRFAPTGYAPEFTETVDISGIHGSSMFPDISGIQLGEKSGRGPRYTTVQGSTQRETPHPQYTTADESQSIVQDIANLGATTSTGIETSADYQPNAPVRTGLSPQQKADAGIGIGAARGSGPAGRGFLTGSFLEEQTSRGVVSDYDAPKGIAKVSYSGGSIWEGQPGFGDNFELDEQKPTKKDIQERRARRAAAIASKTTDDYDTPIRIGLGAGETLAMIEEEKYRRAEAARVAATAGARGESGTEAESTSGRIGLAPQVFDDMGNVIGTTATTPRPPMGTSTGKYTGYNVWSKADVEGPEMADRRFAEEHAPGRSSQQTQNDPIYQSFLNVLSPERYGIQSGRWGSAAHVGGPDDPLVVNAADRLWNTTFTTPRSPATTWYNPETDEFRTATGEWISRDDAHGDGRYGLGNQSMIPGTAFSAWESQLGSFMGANLSNETTPPQTTTSGPRGSGQEADTHYSGIKPTRRTASIFGDFY